jgi:hypothetical protein
MSGLGIKVKFLKQHCIYENVKERGCYWVVQAGELLVDTICEEECYSGAGLKKSGFLFIALYFLSVDRKCSKAWQEAQLEIFKATNKVGQIPRSLGLAGCITNQGNNKFKWYEPSRQWRVREVEGG